MRHTLKIFLFLLVTASSSLAKDLDDSFVWRTISVMGQSGEDFHLAVKVAEKKFISSPNRIKYGDILINANVVDGSAEGVIAEYIKLIKLGEFEKVRDLYETSYRSSKVNLQTIQSVAGFFHQELKGVGEVKFVKSWQYENFFVIVFELIDTSTGNKKTRSLGLKKIGDQYYRADDWGLGDPASGSILGIFYYLTSQSSEKSVNEKSFKYSLSIGKNVPVSIYFDGKLFKYRQEWPDVGTVRNVSPVEQFVNTVLVTTGTLSDKEFIELWVKPEQKKLETLLDRNPNHFASIKRNNEAHGKIMNMYTLAIGNSYMHYFKDSSTPNKVRIVSVREKQGKYYLSNESIYSNIRAVLAADVFRAGIEKLWRRQANQMKYPTQN